MSKYLSLISKNFSFLIDYKWLKLFFEYIDYDEGTLNTQYVKDRTIFSRADPGFIDNSKLVVDSEDIVSNCKHMSADEVRFAESLQSSNSGDCILRKNIKEGEDYALLSAEQWNLLVDWYGANPRIERRITKDKNQIKVELYPLRLWICKESQPEQRYPFLISKADLDFEQDIRNKVMRKLRELSPSNLMTRPTVNMSVLVNGLEYPLSSDLNIQEFSCILVKDRACPQRASPAIHAVENPVVGPLSSSNRYSISENSESSWLDDSDMDIDVLNIVDKNNRSDHSKNNILSRRGLVGLYNIGNTCFLNSAIQCLSNTEALTRFFLEGSWQEDLNEQNPLGMKGLLAEAYCSLLRELWLSVHSSAANPRELKAVISRFAPHFSGYQQHDAQEFLSFLLDGLHEDLNRVRVKPLVEIPTGDGVNDIEVAQLAWQRHRARNDSVLVDLFGGQYRSELVCPVTGRRSVTFDPFNCLTLELPQPTPETRVRVLLHHGPASPTASTRYTLSLPCSATFQDLRRQLAEAAGIGEDRVVLADVFASRFFDFFEDATRVAPSGSRCRRQLVHAYETPVPAKRTFSPVRSRPPFGPAESSGMHMDVRGGRKGTPALQDRDGSYMLLAAVHRRPRRTYYRHVEMEAFGSPTILAVPIDPETGKASYSALWREVSVAAGRLCDPRRAPGGPGALTEKRQSNTARRVRNGSSPGEWEGRVELRRMDAWRHLEVGKELYDDGADGVEGLEAGDTVCIDWTEDGLALVDSDDNDEESDLDDDEDAMTETSVMQGEAGGQGAVKLEELLGAFSEPEVLSESNSWFSPFCRQHVRATKTIAIWSAPAHLIIHLKRFSASADDGLVDIGGYGMLQAERQKLDTFVKFPLRGLDLGAYVRGPGREGGSGIDGLVYDLYAVVNHYGGSGFGHYTACCLSPGDGKWRRFDDSDVETIEDPEGEVVTKAAYLLFYRLRCPRTL